MELLNFYKVMIAVHKKYKMLRSGSLKFLWNDYQGLCYARFSHTEQMIIVLNNRDEGRDVMIEVWRQESADWKKQYLQGWCNLLRKGIQTTRNRFYARLDR